MNRAIVTFNDPKSGQNIIINVNYSSVIDELDINTRLDPIPSENTKIGLIGLLSEIFLTALVENEKSEKSDTSEGNSR